MTRVTHTGTAQTWQSVALSEDPSGLLDAPDLRYRRSAGGALWHLRHGGLLDGDTPLPLYGHIPDPAPGTCGMWHTHPGCYTPSRRKTPEVLTVDHVLAHVMDPAARYTLCWCVSTHPHVALDEDATAALRWLLDTDEVPDTPRHAACVARALSAPPNLTAVPGPLADRVRARAALRRSQLHAAPTTRTYQTGVIYELSHDLAGVPVTDLAATIRARAWFLAGAADELAATYHDVAEKCRDAWFIDDLAPVAAGDGVDSYTRTRRGSLHDAAWTAYTEPSVWLRCTPPGRRAAGQDREYSFLLDANDQLTLVRVPAAFLALPDQRHLPRAATRTLTWTALGVDHGYTADQAAAAARLLDAHVAGTGAFADIVAALAAAAEPARA